MKNTENYRRPLIAVIGLKFVLALKQILPLSIYIQVYKAAFLVYREFLWVSYRWKALGKDRDTKARNRMVSESMPYSLVGWQGLEVTYDAVMGVHTEGIDGAIVECGVAEGGSALLMARLTKESGQPRMTWLFDSYAGLPEPTADDYRDGKTGRHLRPLPKGSCLGTIEQVSKLLFDQFRMPRDNIYLIKGWFQDTLPVYSSKIGPIAVLRLDGDWYESTKCCFEHLYDLVVPGGYVVLDDYVSCYGCQKATDEFLTGRNLSVEIIRDGRGGAYFRLPKPSTAHN